MQAQSPVVLHVVKTLECDKDHTVCITFRSEYCHDKEDDKIVRDFSNMTPHCMHMEPPLAEMEPASLTSHTPEQTPALWMCMTHTTHHVTACTWSHHGQRWSLHL